MKMTIPYNVTGKARKRLAENGYESEVQETADRLTIAVPRDALDNTQLAVLRQIVNGREPLLKRAFHTESLGLEVTDEQIGFPWFGFTQDTDEVNAYTEFVAKLCGMAQRQKRVMPTVTETDNGQMHLPLLSAPAWLHRQRVQSRSEGLAEEPIRQLGVPARRANP